MPKYIVEYGTPLTVDVPSGLYLLVEKVDAHGSAGCEMSGYNADLLHTFTDLNENLNYSSCNTLVFTALDGYANIDVKYVGDQTAYRYIDRSKIQPNNAGNYPGSWGNGTGSK